MIDTVLRLADGSTVPIRLRGTRCGWLEVVTSGGEPVKHCRRGHVLLYETTRPDRYSYRHCILCDRINKRDAARRWYAAHREQHKANMRARYKQAKKGK